VNIVALFAVHFVHVNFTEQYSGYVYFVTIKTAVAHHRQTTISVTFAKFPDFQLANVKFPEFSRRVTTLQ